MASIAIRRVSLGLAALLALVSWAVPSTPQAQEGEEEIAYQSHGSFVNKLGEVIDHPSQAAIDAYFAKLGSRAPGDVLPPPRSYEQYRADCLAEGVPEPPAFDSGQWVSKGRVADEFTSKPVVEILVYDSAAPAGVCVALPRKDPTPPTSSSSASSVRASRRARRASGTTCRTTRPRIRRAGAS